MGFKQVLDLEASKCISLGGVDKNTGQKNSTSAEGYFIGTRQTDSKYGPGKLHILNTPEGNLGVWGKTDMDRKLSGVAAGTMIRITYTGEVPSNKGNPMKKFKVEVDNDNCLDVSGLNTNPAVSADEEEEERGLDEAEFDQPDETVPTYNAPPSRPTPAPSPDRQKRVQDLVAGRVKRAS